MLTGSIVALITPMDLAGDIDYSSLTKIIQMHINNGTSAIVIAGSTGELSTLSVEEHISLLRFSVECADGKVPIIAGVGGNSTREVIELGESIGGIGVEAALSVVPYYNKPTQEGIYQHFLSISENVAVPQILYNIPGRSACDMSNETLIELSKIPNIIGLKDATSDLARAVELFKAIPEGFAFYSGDDATALPYMLMGGHGCISVSANIVPLSYSNMCRAALAGELSVAKEINEKLLSLNNALGFETNPIPVKYFMEKMDMALGGIRLPLTRLDKIYHEQVEVIIADIIKEKL